MIDSHTHLDMAAEAHDVPVAELVQAAQDAGVERILTIGMGADGSEEALAYASAHEGVVHASVGHHPNSATGFTDEDAEALAALAQDPRCRAIGETGLDEFRDDAPLADQQRAFEAQIAIARQAGKPLVIHSRAADDPTIDTLKRHAHGLEVILHCFGMPDRVDECLAAGWWISFAGNVTYPKAADLAAASDRVPLDRLLVETDAPFLTPQKERKHRNRPQYVVHTAQFLADRRRLDVAELDAAVSANAAKLFGW